MINEIIRGDTLILDVQITDNDGVEFDISNSTLIFTVKAKIEDPDSASVIQVRQTTHTDPNGGRSIIKIPAQMTANLQAGKVYYWDIQLVKNDLVATVAYGTFKVKADITRSI